MSAAAEAPVLLLCAAAEFVADVARVNSIIERMQDVMAERVKEAEAGDGKIDACIVEAFFADIAWLIDRIEDDTSRIWVKFRDQALPMPKRV